MTGLEAENMSLERVFIRKADEVKVFETFGGDLPVLASQPKAVTQNGRATGPTNVRQAAYFCVKFNDRFLPNVQDAAGGAGTGRRVTFSASNGINL